MSSWMGLRRRINEEFTLALVMGRQVGQGLGNY